VFGHIGDKMGRKAALTSSVILMAVPTFLIGLLPTYQQIGITAALLLVLVLLRLVQGLSVGGEYTTSAIFLVERSGPGRRGFLGSFGPFGACGGMLFRIGGRRRDNHNSRPGVGQRLGMAAPFHIRDQRGPFRALHPPSHAQ
jgi:MFS family permease